ncbi:DUF6064 family protein [Geminicoccus roseus]|uniref:DUF6064 family protein n=1 Tax=Geminicoccus roseus TaxID=404900 RepID=UPI0003FAB658|nr:DUF6064 family protein [Geminicoccus roseus]
MEGGASYRLEDFLLFSSRTYFRLVTIHHEAIWPAQVLAVLAGAVIVALMWRWRWPWAVPVLLAIAWAWVAWSWFHLRYATINWAADHGALAFGAEALLLLVLAATGSWSGAAGWPRRAGIGLVLAALLAAPLAAPLAGRDWAQIDLFGATPDATAMVTLGTLVAARGRWRWLAMPIPLLWCAAAGATLAAMEAPDAWVAPGFAMLALLLAIAAAWRTEPAGAALRHLGVGD